MDRAVFVGLLFLMVAELFAATPTTPFISNAYKLPRWYLSRSRNGTLNVTKVVPQYPSFTVATAQYNASNNGIGWDYLKIKPVVAPTSGEAYYFAGYLEGYLTQKVMAYQGFSYMPGPRTLQWINEHIAYMRNMSQTHRSYDSYWQQVYAILQQVQGLADGYSAAPGAKPIAFLDVFVLNFAAELGDVETHFQAMTGKPFKRSAKQLQGHCSALIKVTHDDLFVAHDTWNGFSFMVNRMYKVYEFQTTVAFSSYAGMIVSMDDWYMTSNQLAVQETTNVVWNTSLFTAVVPQTISEFVRVMSANFLANSGEEWTTYFSRENSGTYNNQYMVVDYKLYIPGATIVDGTLWVLEQIPGYIHRADESHVLREQGYWASYNIAYFKDIFDLSGYQQMVDTEGNIWSYSKYARAEIFRRNQSQIHTLPDMMRMMRYNNFRADDLSAIPNCVGAPDNLCGTPRSSMLAIASRGDLLPVFNDTQEMISQYGPDYEWVAQGCFGAIDSKIASWKNRFSLTGYLVSGPTNDQQPTFSWSDGSCTGTPRPAGTPETYDFPWVAFVNQPGF